MPTNPPVCQPTPFNNEQDLERWVRENAAADCCCWLAEHDVFIVRPVICRVVRPIPRPAEPRPRLWMFFDE
jgi:hypothetical protein